ncbi:kinase-like domain-containing protein [Ganoderma leucocontextum]|nr:kinase-like domain-containing protein [Ganoderma leucocontextum]
MLLDAIQYIHEKGIIHCDIKTSNFVFGRKSDLGRLYLIDFGLCQFWSDRDTPEKRLAIGTLDYCSEHILRGHAPARRDDVANRRWAPHVTAPAHDLALPDTQSRLSPARVCQHPHVAPQTYVSMRAGSSPVCGLRRRPPPFPADGNPPNHRV